MTFNCDCSASFVNRILTWAQRYMNEGHASRQSSQGTDGHFSRGTRFTRTQIQKARQNMRLITCREQVYKGIVKLSRTSLMMILFPSMRHEPNLWSEKRHREYDDELRDGIAACFRLSVIRNAVYSQRNRPLSISGNIMILITGRYHCDWRQTPSNSVP